MPDTIRTSGILIFALLVAGLTGHEAAAAVRPETPDTPRRPAGCLDVSPGQNLARMISDESGRDAFCLQPGRHPGSLLIDRALTIWGTADSIVTSGGDGTTIRVRADGVRLAGFTIDGSGNRYDKLDAALHVGADHARVEGLTIVNAIYGIVVEKSRSVTLANNRIRGRVEQTLGLRGDAIRLWETYDSEVRGNVVLSSRDVVIWYSSGNRVEGNTVEGSRYGTHFMYSHDNHVVGNHYDGNVVGIFAMYSRNVTIENNRFAHARGAAGMGLGIKDSGNLVVRDNLFLNERVCIYSDNSPNALGDRNRFEGNELRFCGRAIVFHSDPAGNELVANVLADNLEQVFVDGGGDALSARWEENYFDDYAGYDLDRDGYGDIPYELRRLSTELRATHPDLTFFTGTASLFVADAISQIVPLFAPRLVVRDPRPRMHQTVRNTR